MTSPEIKPAIPIPPALSARKYPWPTMRDGDSFEVEGAKARKSAMTSFDAYKRTRQAAGHVVPFKLVTRSMGGGRYRLWLIHTE